MPRRNLPEKHRNPPVLRALRIAFATGKENLHQKYGLQLGVGGGWRPTPNAPFFLCLKSVGINTKLKR